MAVSTDERVVQRYEALGLLSLLLLCVDKIEVS